MRQKIRKLLSTILQTIDALLCRLHLRHPRVILYMDGGICSQMLMYIQGRYYAEHGFDVRYDIRWFDVCGKDQFGNHPRTFEFTDMWPALPFQSIRGWRLWVYRHLFKYGNWMNGVLPHPDSITHSIYLIGYWDLPEGLYDDMYRTYFNMANAATPQRGGGIRTATNP